MFRYHKFIMKPTGLKKILYFLLLMCGVLIFYLMRYQFSPLSNLSLRLSNKQEDLDQKGAPAQTSKHNQMWTWKCESEKCIRYQRTAGEPVSLATCNMLCGSMQLWPKPTGPVSLGSHTLSFIADQIVFETSLSGTLGNLLNEAFACFKENVVKMCGNSGNLKQSDINSFRISVNVIHVNLTKLNFNTDESYSLILKTVKTDLVVTIKASTFFGARHGFETLSQLIWWDEFTHGGTLKVLKGALVNDSPTFPYRGLMLDTARNFIPIPKIKKVLVGMATNKLNVFHWHITDSQSFPFMSVRVPKMSAFGAYGRDMIYHPDDIKDIVNYALVRGIRVVIEIDTPAHAGNGWNWGPSEGLGELAVCVNEQPWSAYCGEPPCGQLNPINPNTYDVLEKLYKDIIELTNEDEIFHLGGDEVNLECWSRKLRWTNETGYYTDLHDLWGNFTLQALHRLKRANGGKLPRHVVMWSSNLSKKPYTTKYLNKKNIVIQVWGPLQWGEGAELLRDGYRLILSHVDAWYLDCGFGRWREMGDAACDPYRTWQSVYLHRPWQFLGTNRHNILGGEVCLWSEQVDVDSVESRLWPRAAAFAERVWNDPPIDEYAIPGVNEDVYTRLSMQRDRLLTRGIKAEAMWPQWCSHNPGMCL